MSAVSSLLVMAFRRRRLLHGAVLLLLLLMLLCAIFVGSYSNDLSQMFPEDSLSGSMFRSMRDASLTQAVQIEVDTGMAGGIQGIATELADFASRLEKLQQVRSVLYKVPRISENTMDELVAALPFCVNAKCLKTADAKVAVQTAKKLLSMPGVPLSILRSDPFGLRLQLLSHLETFRQLGGYGGGMDGVEYISDAEKRRALLLLEPDFGGENPGAAQIKALFSLIEELAKESLPSNAAITIVSPLRHNLDNETMVRHDIFNVSLVSFLALIVLFVLFYRNALGALWIPILPLAASIVTAGIFALVFRETCLFVLGIGGGIAGLAVDQGIHVFAALSRKRPLHSLRSIAAPLACSALSSALVFLLVCGSGIGAYIQLGLFAAFTLVFNLLFSYFLLPTLLTNGKPPRRLFRFTPTHRSATVVTAVWGVFAIASLCCIPLIKKDFSLNALDGVTRETATEEKEFQERWTHGAKAGIPVIVSCSDREMLLQTCEKLPMLLGIPEKLMFHPAMLLPSQERMDGNLAGWRGEKTRERLDTLNKELQRECIAAGLPPKLFDKFFSNIEKSLDGGKLEPPAFAKAIGNYLLHDSSAIAFIPPPYDEGEVSKLLNYSLPNIKQFSKSFGFAVVSHEIFTLATTKDIAPRVRRIIIMLIFALIIFLIQYKNIVNIIIIIMPGMTSMLGVAMMSVVFGVKLNLATIFGMIMLTGLVLDYGIFALHRARSDVDAGTGDAMMLSALTTVLTSGALIASRHPVLFHTGFVLSIGIFVTAVTALFVIPSLVVLRGLRGKAVLLLLAAVFMSGCMSLSPQKFPKRKLSLETRTAETEEFNSVFHRPRTTLYTLNTSFLHYDFKILMAVRIKSDSIQAIGTASNGVTLFNIVVENGKETKRTFSQMIPEVAQRRLFGTFGEDLWSIFMDDASKNSLNGNPLRLTEKKGKNMRQNRWQAVYYDWRQDDGVFDRIVFRNFKTLTTFTLVYCPH